MKLWVPVYSGMSLPYLGGHYWTDMDINTSTADKDFYILTSYLF